MRRSSATAVLWVGAVVLLVSAAVFTSSGHAGGKIFLEEWKLPDFYPRGFDGYGRIDKVFEDRIIINDSSKKLSNKVTYAVPSSPHASKSSFRVGNTVGYLLDNKKEITSLWLIK